MNTMKKDLATPRPWKIDDKQAMLRQIPLGGIALKTYRRDYDEYCAFAQLKGVKNDEDIANAELIVHAVNNFDALLVACKFVLQEWDEPESAPQCLEMLRKAIANAEK